MISHRAIAGLAASGAVLACGSKEDRPVDLRGPVGIAYERKIPSGPIPRDQRPLGAPSKEAFERAERELNGRELVGVERELFARVGPPHRSIGDRRWWARADGSTCWNLLLRPQYDGAIAYVASFPSTAADGERFLDCMKATSSAAH